MRPDTDSRDRPDDASAPPDEWAGVCVRYLRYDEDDPVMPGDTVYCYYGPEERDEDPPHGDSPVESGSQDGSPE